VSVRLTCVLCLMRPDSAVRQIQVKIRASRRPFSGADGLTAHSLKVFTCENVSRSYDLGTYRA
jgi:hypothetical protein